jgi:NADH dehydrogenase
VIVRPSFVFGRGGALPTFIRQVKLSPVVTVIGPGTQRLQPVWLEDVAQFFATVVDDARAPGRIWELCGPDVVTWNELYEEIAPGASARSAPAPSRRRRPDGQS